MDGRGHVPMPPSSNGGPPSGDGVGPLGWHGSAAGVESIRTRDGTRLGIWTWGCRTSGPRPRPGHAVDEPPDDVRHHRDGRRRPVSHPPPRASDRPLQPEGRRQLRRRAGLLGPGASARPGRRRRRGDTPAGRDLRPDGRCAGGARLRCRAPCERGAAGPLVRLRSRIGLLRHAANEGRARRAQVRPGLRSHRTGARSGGPPAPRPLGSRPLRSGEISGARSKPWLPWAPHARWM